MEQLKRDGNVSNRIGIGRKIEWNLVDVLNKMQGVAYFKGKGARDKVRWSQGCALPTSRHL